MGDWPPAKNLGHSENCSATALPLAPSARVDVGVSVGVGVDCEGSELVAEGDVDGEEGGGASWCVR
jgi:hypothetical protein